MDVNCSNQQDEFNISAKQIEEIAKKILSHYKVKTDEISFYFVDEQTISDLHKQFFDDNSVTDCITFPLDPPNTSSPSNLGEVFVCPKTAEKYATSNQLDTYQEITLYVIHGILHLLGYDDIDPSDEKIMREQEQICMKILNDDNLALNGY